MRKYSTILLLLFVLPLCTMAQGGVSTSLFTGRMSYTIPIYTIEDPDFKVDLALSYSSDGFKPFQPSGCYGQDWSLIAGGCVTRSIQGLPDDLNYYGQITKYYYRHNTDDIVGVCGYITGWEKGFARALMKMDESGSILDKEKVYNMDRSVYSDSCGILYKDGVWIDYMPDIFYFNFCGHSGRFMINNSGKVVILNGDFVEVDISKIGTDRETYYDEFSWNVSRTKPAGFFGFEKSKIVIKTMDGYTYVFGGSPESLEYSIEARRDSVKKESFSIIDAWHITKITAPNGRTLEFYYKSADEVGNSHYNDNRIPRSLHSLVTDLDWANSEKLTHLIFRLQKTCLLSSIKNSDSVKLEISFYSSPEEYKMYNRPDYKCCTAHQKLDSIIVQGGERVLRKVKLSYEYRVNGQDTQYNSYWRFLKDVAVSGAGKYTMSYLQTPTNINMYPSNDAEYKKNVDRYGFWKESSLAGMLSRVDLPTGGFLKFTYGHQEYGQERSYKQRDNDCYVSCVQTTNEDTSIGGARIEKIETYSSTDKLEETKMFSYEKETKSTGIFYNIHNVYKGDGTTLPVENPHNYNLIASHIGYSYVEQETIIGTERQKTALSFDTGRLFSYSIRSMPYNINLSVPKYDVNKELSSGSLTHDAYLIAPGKVAQIESFVGDSKVKSIQYVYNNGATQYIHTPRQAYSEKVNIFGCVDTIVCLSTYSAHIAHQLYVCPDVLEKVVTQEYDADGRKMETIQTITYDKKLRQKKILTTDSRGRQLFTKYTYPDNISTTDSVNGSPSPLYSMIQSNCVGSPVETISGYIENETEYVTGGSVNLYAYNEYPYLSQTLSLGTSMPISYSAFQPTGELNGQITYDARYKLTCQFNYDTKGRPTTVIPFGKVATNYTWSGLYPSTKTIGNQTWRYEYIPYVGVKSTTDPRGITTYYTYDADGRLVEEYQVVNGNKQILHAYQYHIKTEEK